MKVYGLDDDKVTVNFPSMHRWNGDFYDLVKVDSDTKFKCWGCNHEHNIEDMTKVYDYVYGVEKIRFVCSQCIDDYNVCADCGRHITESNTFDFNGKVYCKYCYDIHKPRLYDYHEFNDWKLFGDGKYYIGKEIELEPLSCSNRDGVLCALQHINAVGMRDGSLNDGGVEVVTHPESWDYLQKHKQNYIDFFDEINSIEYGNEENCGLHFHVSRPNDEVIARIIVLLESFKDEIITLSRRSSSDLSSWAKFYSDSTSDEMKKMQYKSKKYIKDSVVNNSYFGRYMALNLENEKTIEFRFFDGVNNFEEFWGALQFIHNIMEIALDEKRELNTISWRDLISGSELINQAKNLGVWDIDKFAKDTTEILETYKEKLEKTKKEVRRILKNWARRINKDMSEMEVKDLRCSDLCKMQQKYDDFMKKLKYKKNFLDKIYSIYSYLEGDYSLEQTKDYLNYTKRNYPNNFKQYERYEKLINKEIDKFEKEVK